MKTLKPRRSHALIALGTGALLLSVGCASAAGPEDISTTREADLVLRDAQADVQQQIDAGQVDAAPDPCGMGSVASAIAWICCDVSDSKNDAVDCMANDCSQLCGANPPTDALVGCYPDPETHQGECFQACTHAAQGDINRSATAGTCGGKSAVPSDAGKTTGIAPARL